MALPISRDLASAPTLNDLEDAGFNDATESEDNFASADTIAPSAPTLGDLEHAGFDVEGDMNQTKPPAVPSAPTLEDLEKGLPSSTPTAANLCEKRDPPAPSATELEDQEDVTVSTEGDSNQTLDPASPSAPALEDLEEGRLKPSSPTLPGKDMIVCGLCDDHAQEKASCCSGAIPHYLCDPCFCGYAKAELDPTGAFEGERKRPGHDQTSHPGELPCYLFLTGECDCASIPATTFAKVLSTDANVLELYDQAKRRRIEAEVERERRINEEARLRAQENETVVDRLRQEVMETLSRGSYVKCPDCDLFTQKDDACMHMRCQCGTRYCYCCGRRRGHDAGECPSDGFGCDTPSPYLEGHPGWGGFALAGETQGLGALHEFHQRRTAYFLRHVKARHPPEVWAELRRVSPEILEEVPTPGRRIPWDEIDGAVAPIFGETAVDQVRWAEEEVNTNVETDTEVETNACEICGENTENAMQCSGAVPHFVCEGCFCDYASAEFNPTGAFEGERRGPGDVVSQPGELPCFKFVTGECGCAAIPATTIARVLSSNADVLEEYERSKRRLVAAEEERARREAEEAQRRAQERETPVDRLRAVVREALSRGGHVACPDCGVHGQKNDACMHMTCPCGTRYCYCCGRRSGAAVGECRRGGGCDETSPFLERHPGWGRFALAGETQGMGALHEFHRRRMAYFLRQVKATHSPNIWADLRHQSPDILDEVPTQGRRINWYEIDGAVPPLFGRTRANQLRWANEGEGARQAVDEQNAEHAPDDEPPDEEDREEKEDPYATWIESFPVNRLLWFWGLGFLVTFVLLCTRAANDGKGLRIVGSIGIAALAISMLPILLLRVVNNFAQNPDGFARHIREVQCFGGREVEGREVELPYLATGGRWNHFRMVYWMVFIGCISLGSLLVGNADGRGFYGIGSFLLMAVFLFYGCGTVVVNYAPQPAEGLEPLRSRYRSSLARLCFYGVLFSIGVGLAAASDGNSAGRDTGKVFITLGFAGAAAEITPRLATAMFTNVGNPLSRTPDFHRLCLAYWFFGSISVGSLMVGLSGESSEGLHKFGATLLALCFVGTIGGYFVFVRGRPF